MYFITFSKRFMLIAVSATGQKSFFRRVTAEHFRTGMMVTAFKQVGTEAFSSDLLNISVKTAEVGLHMLLGHDLGLHMDQMPSCQDLLNLVLVHCCSSGGSR